MKNGKILFRTNSSICHVVVLKYFEATKTVRSRQAANRKYQPLVEICLAACHTHATLIDLLQYGQ